MGVNLLYYRPWRGSFRSPEWTVWPIARVALGMLFRRRLFWVLFGCSLFFFLMFFFGQFLLDKVEDQLTSSPVLQRDAAAGFLKVIRRASGFLNGSQHTYRYFFAYQGTILIVTLTLVGSVLVGNDFAFGSLPFYLSKPVSRWHYILGKCLAAGIVINLMTTLPALLLYVYYGFGNWDYVLNSDYFQGGEMGSGPAGLPLLSGIVGYGLVLTVCLSIMLVATASILRRTMPMILGWTGLFLFLPLVATILVDPRALDLNENWRLLDFWNDLCLVGNACLGIDGKGSRGGVQPELAAAVLVLGATCILCLSYLNLRTRAVEVVR
jgi:ABC-type transport system involved in multi-copper enzyme maturation permease subunit